MVVGKACHVPLQSHRERTVGEEVRVGSAPTPEDACSAPLGLGRQLLREPGLANPRLAADQDHAALSPIGSRELRAELVQDQVAAHEWRVPGFAGDQLATRLDRSLIGLRLRGPPCEALGEDVLIETERLLLRNEAQLLSQHVPADLELANGLVPGSHLRVQDDEAAMDVLPGGIVVEHLAKAICGCAVLAAFPQRVGQLQHEPCPHFRQEGTAIRTPVLIAVLG